MVDVAGLRIAGLGGSIRYNDGPNQWTERQQARRAAKVARTAARRTPRRARGGRAADPLPAHGLRRPGGSAAPRFRLPAHGVERLRPAVLTARTHPPARPAGARTERWEKPVCVNTVGYRILDIPDPGRAMNRDTGFPVADAENDFLRMRRRQVMSRLAAVAAPLAGRREHHAAVRRGRDRARAHRRAAAGPAGDPRWTRSWARVDRTREFDRRFRPTSGQVRERWQRLALAQRRGESVPPIEVYRVGDMHFVVDGHHRVSVAHALGLKTIDAYVTEVTTRLSARGRAVPRRPAGEGLPADLPGPGAADRRGTQGDRRWTTRGSTRSWRRPSRRGVSG